MIDFLLIGIALLLLCFGARLIAWIAMRLGVLALVIAGIIFLIGILGGH